MPVYWVEQVASTMQVEKTHANVSLSLRGRVAINMLQRGAGPLLKGVQAACGAQQDVDMSGVQHTPLQAVHQLMHHTVAGEEGVHTPGGAWPRCLA